MADLVIPSVPTTTEEAEAAMTTLQLFLGGGFHPDTGAGEYVGLATKQPTFTDAEAQRFDAVMDAVFKLVADPYGLCLDIHVAHPEDM